MVSVLHFATRILYGCELWYLFLKQIKWMQSTVEPGYNDVGLYDTWHIALDILCYKLIPHCYS